MTDNDEIVGHKTFSTPGGGFRHEPIRKIEADAIMARVELADQRRKELMPTEQDAVRMMFQARIRLQELGWRDTCYGPTNELVQLIESGSSGIHQGMRWKPWPETTWWLDGDSPSQAILFKPLEPKPQPSQHNESE